MAALISSRSKSLWQTLNRFELSAPTAYATANVTIYKAKGRAGRGTMLSASNKPSNNHNVQKQI